MAPHLVEGDSALQAWRAGALFLLANGNWKNLITTIHEPCTIDEAWLTDYSPHLVRPSGDRAKDVANTLFPLRLAIGSPSRAALYARYLERHDRAHRWARGRNTWGTYFERLVRFPTDEVNQLERAITKLLTWPRNTTGLVFHLSCPATDSPRTRGGPCWHFGELLWNPGGTLDLVVTYRNHDFFNKVLGNFVGLGRLLRFICAEAGKQPGQLVCHSVHAYIDGPAMAMRALLK